ncbi:P2R1A-PPP2R2A-interacting phosphatase regulator 1-like [Urocitellus parryii]|uniref:protein FAM122A-like n=1 Tax=Urocitellus parryii TaxID=9999 RepID=UPI000E55E5CE|nr:protein FAM122A-like [Urocitellus parryii]
MDVVNREAMHEREVHTAIQISQSWEENLKLNDDDLDTPSTVKSIDLIPVSQAASLTKWIGKVKYHLMISQDTANIHPVILPSCQ